MRTFPRVLRSRTALFLIVWSCMLHGAPALAGLAPSRLSGATTIASTRDADLVLAQRALENRLVRQKLADYGVQPNEVEMRLASMSDEDLHTLATASRGLPSGADGIGAIIGILVIVILVIVVLRLLNKEVVVR